MFEYETKKNNVEVASTKILQRNIKPLQLMSIARENNVINYLLKNNFAIYAGGYLVYNFPEYVVETENGYSLTQHGLNNIEKCTVNFMINLNAHPVIHVRNRLARGPGHSGMKARMRSTSVVTISNKELQNIINTFRNLEDIQRKKDFFAKFKYTESGYYFDAYLKLLMKRYSFTISKLSEKSLISESTIKKYRGDSNKTISYRVVLALCVGMNCLPFEMFSILKIIGYYIEYVTDFFTEEQQAHHDLIVNHFDKDIHFWNNYLKSKGLPILK